MTLPSDSARKQERDLLGYLHAGAANGRFHDATAAARTARLLTDRGGPRAATAGNRAVPEHLTASALVVSPDLTRVLLTLHRKAGRWLQFGGHMESGDAGPWETARREAREESGLAELTLLADSPVNISVHELPAAFGNCRVHDDIMYAAIAEPTAPIAASAESTTIGWHRLDRLPDLIAPDLPPRLPGIIAEVRSLMNPAERADSHVPDPR